jgi:hypothetical protein
MQAIKILHQSVLNSAQVYMTSQFRVFYRFSKATIECHTRALWTLLHGIELCQNMSIWFDATLRMPLRPKHNFSSFKKPLVQKPRRVQCALTCHLLVQICRRALASTRSRAPWTKSHSGHAPLGIQPIKPTESQIKFTRTRCTQKVEERDHAYNQIWKLFSLQAQTSQTAPVLVQSIQTPSSSPRPPPTIIARSPPWPRKPGCCSSPP